MRKYLELVRFSHSLFAMPFALASMLLAAGGLPSFKTFLLIVLAMVLNRNVAMAFNRLVDAKIDAGNPRTQKRHLPAGSLSKFQVVVFILLNALGFIFVCYYINPLAFYLSVPALLIVCAYSLMKRFTWLCHFFLGLAIGISPLGAWIAVRGEFALLPALLGFALLLWVGGFDIIYATQDYEFDKKAGLFSMVSRWGLERALMVAKVSHALMVILLLGIGYLFQLGLPYNIAVISIGILLAYINFFRKSNSLDSLNRDFFMANVSISLVLMVGIATSVFLVQPSI